MTVSDPVPETDTCVPAFPLNVTDFTPTKLAPLMVTLVPPLIVPLDGEIVVMCGAFT